MTRVAKKSSIVLFGRQVWKESEGYQTSDNGIRFISFAGLPLQKDQSDQDTFQSKNIHQKDQKWKTTR